MNMREKDGTIYIYRDKETFLASMEGSYLNGMQMMYAADYAIQLVPQPGRSGAFAKVIKDRSGVLSREGSTFNVKKLLKIIEILAES